MYKLKNVVRRGSAFLGAVGLVAGITASALPGVASADALNPLVERSLTLSSSSPGWAYTDGSGNSTYAPPNSGANGQKAGNYFSFKVSTDSSPSGTNEPIKAMSFQYCTGSAGACAAPGDDVSHGTDTATTADLNVHYVASAQEVGDTSRDGAAGDVAKVFDLSRVTNPEGLVSAVPGYTNENPKYQAGGGTGDPAEAAQDVPGTFLVVYRSSPSVDWQVSQSWTVSTSNQEEAVSGTTGQQNTIILENSTGLGLPAGAQVKVFFFATADNYITNPGSGYFFVKINTFKNFDALDDTPGSENTLADNIAKDPSDVIDGGVTVANVMNQSIQITTKVLETMEFSVGTVDPNTLDSTQLAASENKTAGTHAPCNTILTRMKSPDPQNVLQLGDQTQESSLKTTVTYATHSYWRLSSNSSAGATVYYSGHTLSNTSGDEITPIGVTASKSMPGSEQFGLALDTIALSGSTGVARLDSGTYGVDYSTAGIGGAENGADNTAAGVVAAGTTPGAGGVHNSVLTDLGADLVTPSYTGLNKSYHTPKLDPLVPTTNYGSGSGLITGAVGPGQAQFAFDPMSDTVPTAIATENNQVVDCVTGKMRYIANIAATTPAGIYTTKVNYIAAPQY